LSFGDPAPCVDAIRASAAVRMLQVTDLDEAKRAVDLIADAEAKQAYRDGVARGDFPPVPIWAGEAVGLIHDLPSARDLVGTMAAQAEAALTRPRAL